MRAIADRGPTPVVAPPSPLAIRPAAYAYVKDPFDLVTRRWTAAVVLYLGDGSRRFNEMLRGIEGISDRLLTERLRDLVDFGLVERRVDIGPPIRVHYLLTEPGHELVEPLRAIARVLSP